MHSRDRLDQHDDRAMVFGTLCAYSIVRFRTGGENLAVWILSQRMLPPIAVVFRIFLLYAKVGWADTT